MTDTEAPLPPLPEPIDINWPTLNSHALGCGVEDRGIHDRYEAAEYGWQDGAEMAASCVPEQVYDATQMCEYARACVLADRASRVSQQPVAWMWQHDETGRTGFVDVWQVENGWQQQNPRLRLIRPLVFGDSVVPPVQPSGATLSQAAIIKYVPVDSRLRDGNWNHPKDDEPRTEACRAALTERGDDVGQGLDGYWKWGFAAGFNAAATLSQGARSQWISVDERLPEIDYSKASYERRVKCLVTTEAGWVAEMVYESNGGAKTERGRAPRWIWQGRVSPWRIIAWQPLPSPYMPQVEPGASAERSSEGEQL